MTELLQWTAIQINRRRFLKRVAGGAFATYAGFAIDAPSAFAQSCPYPCTGPYSSGNCNTYVSGTCNGAACTSVYGVTCDYHSGSCPGGAACWTTSGHVCCDCYCGDYEGDHWYCYCNS
jgi:hypothetical protein